LLHRLVNYDVCTVYVVPPIYVYLGGVGTLFALLFAGTFLDFSFRLVVLVSVVVSLFLVRGLFGWQQRRFANQLFRQLPDVVELVTSTVRAGLPVVEAFRIIAREMPEPTAGQFDLVCKELALGKAPEDALELIHQRTHVAEYGMFAVTLAVQLKSGGSLAETLQTLGDTVRQRVGLAARAKALAAEVIFSARALTAAPFVVGGLFYLTNPRGIDMLFTDPFGRMLLAYAISSVIMGSLVIRWMIRRETSL
jgi:tight adherence protein B